MTRRRQWSHAAAAPILLLLAAAATQAAAKSDKAPPPRQRRPRPAFRTIQENPALPRVLLIGDSISIGYTEPVRKLLAGTANVLRIPMNGGPTTRGLQHLDRWLGVGRLDVIHVNFGLHDCRIMWPKDELQVDLPTYEANLKKIVARLKQTGATVIWATTTAVVDGHRRKRRNRDVQQYNAAARRIMEAEGIAINDLYAALMAIDESRAQPGKGGEKALPFTRQDITTPDGTHFTPRGYQFLAERVAAAIRQALAAR